MNDIANGPNQSLLCDIGQWEDQHPGVKIRYRYYKPEEYHGFVSKLGLCIFHFEYDGEEKDSAHKHYQADTWEEAFSIMMSDVDVEYTAKRLLKLCMKVKELTDDNFALSLYLREVCRQNSKNSQDLQAELASRVREVTANSIMETKKKQLQEANKLFNNALNSCTTGLTIEQADELAKVIENLNIEDT